MLSILQTKESIPLPCTMLFQIKMKDDLVIHSYMNSTSPNLMFHARMTSIFSLANHPHNPLKTIKALRVSSTNPNRDLM